MDHEPMRPHVYTEGAVVDGWWMSEKLDGIRAYWDGRNLWSRNGTPFHPPEFFVAGLPPFAVEGELWAGRQSFEKTASMVMKQYPHEGWKDIRMGIFDLPGDPEPFRIRIGKAVAWFTENPSDSAFVIDQKPVKDTRHLAEELAFIEGMGGEGLIVRDPDALYEKGRSAQILKVKSSEDGEALVLAHVPGRGRNSGKMGSLFVRELESGKEFRIGSGFTDQNREQPPPVGSVITFQYYGRYDSGIPKFASFVRIRQDHGF
ncbi:DNA ligase [Desulfobotulus sp. H1]|uniref:DNA ligase n=2 Tax=Desulfobotulus pelophilus TaxID=2823377 RepID=A0ABT3N8T9_9BACT|nr:DNA ligase [Desulfobotulus pelophilus]MCW7753873.1 DNA ligase [Desulfobotulus pelophilus]